MSTWTAPTTLNLTTPAALVHGLGLLGLRWDAAPHDFDDKELGAGHGLYAWVDGRNTAPPMERGILYNGISRRADGYGRRLHDEMSWATEEYRHGHGLAVMRTNALPVGGPIHLEPTDVTWMDTQFDVYNEALPAAYDWLINDQATAVQKAERIAIRLSIHLGDTGAPVNSAHAGSWEVNHHSELLAYRVSERMKE